jgi:hypothetical protein
MGLLYLNSAAFSFWVAGGPPNDFPESWIQRGIWHLCIAFALFSVGAAVFFAMPKFPKLSKIGICFLGMAVVLLIVPVAREFLISDACLDSGGSWNKGEFRCQR